MLLLALDAVDSFLLLVVSRDNFFFQGEVPPPRQIVRRRGPEGVAAVKVDGSPRNLATGRPSIHGLLPASPGAPYHDIDGPRPPCL